MDDFPLFRVMVIAFGVRSLLFERLSHCYDRKTILSEQLSLFYERVLYFWSEVYIPANIFKIKKIPLSNRYGERVRQYDSSSVCCKEVSSDAY